MVQFVQMWHLLQICYTFVLCVNPFFRPVPELEGGEYNLTVNFNHLMIEVDRTTRTSVEDRGSKYTL